MSTRPLICIPPRQKAAEQASPRIGNAHGAVDKALHLHIRRYILPDFPDFLKGKLPGTDHPLCPQLMPEPVGHIIGVVCLRGNVDINFRADSFCQHKHSRVRDNQRVRRKLPEFFKIFFGSRQIPVMRQNVCRHMHPHVSGMGKGDSLFHILMGKVFGFGAQAESLSSYVYGVRAEQHCRF